MKRPFELTDAGRAYLDEVVAAAPPFTPEQRGRLRPLLAGTIPPRAAHPHLENSAEDNHA